MRNSELLPCPFCGREAEVREQCNWYAQFIGHVAWCPTCHVETWACRSREQAVAAWNTRAETVLLDEQYSHAMWLVEELHQVLSLNGGGTSMSSDRTRDEVTA